LTGFWALDDVPSPKVQNHDVGAPEDKSVKKTFCPTTGENGENVKFAVGGEPPVETTTECMTGELEPEPFVAVSVTL
jgi:hypothetical protein